MVTDLWSPVILLANILKKNYFHTIL